MSGKSEHSREFRGEGAGGFDAVVFLATARERGVAVAREGQHVRVEPGSANWRDWISFAAAAEDHEPEILAALSGPADRAS